MIEEKIGEVRRAIGIDDKEPPRSSWLAPLAVGVAAIGGVLALVVSRIRGRSQAKPVSKTAAKATSKPRTSTRSRSSQSRSTASAKSSTPRRSRSTSTAKRTTAKKPASAASSSD